MRRLGFFAVLLLAGIAAAPLRADPAVELKPVKTTFKANQTVTLEVHVLKRPVWAENLNGSPAILVVQQRSEGNWIRVGPIVVGGAKAVQLPVGVTRLSIEWDRPLPPGTYRAYLQFRGTADRRGPQNRVVSRIFRVR
ncbi:MAG: hypothetical protein HY319_02715 [Armatimonadetes bacterium]|nr:hypothetical protein [Armatimonadota bacterium]